MDRKHGMASKGKSFPHPRNRFKNNEKYKKFIGNRSEGQGFADKRKRKIQYEYMKMLRKEKQKQRRPQQLSAGQSFMTEFDRETVTRPSDEDSKTLQVKNETNSFSGHSLMSDIDHRGQSSSKNEGHCTKKKHNKGQDVQDVSTELSSEGESTKHSPVRFRDRHHKQFRKDDHVGQKGFNRFSKVAEESRQRKEARARREEEYQEGKRRHDEAMQSYRQRKHETFKKICKKTHKGQPIMKYQIEHLLEKIEKQVNYK